MQTTVRTRIAFDDAEVVLAQGQDVAELRRRIEEAVRAGGGFVEFLVVGGRSVSILIGASTRVVITVEAVGVDQDDGGVGAHLSGEEFDLL
jgi:hypothetical protein